MSFRCGPVRLAAVSFIIGGLLAVPVVGFAHCSPYQGSFEAIIVSLADDGVFYASTNKINTYSLQVWGAPWCQIIDVHTIQSYSSGGWTQKGSKAWTSYKSVDSGWHPGYARSWSFIGLYNGTWRFKNSAYRVSSHNQLFGYGLGDIFQHLYDIDSTYESGTL